MSPYLCSTKLKIKIDHAILEKISSEGKTPILIMNSEKVVGYCAVADTLKTTAKATVQNLRRQGLNVVLLSGDAQKTVQYIANQVGIADYYAEVLPAQKLEIIRDLQKQGTVAMVGDGINDAPALVAADVGIAMGTGTDIAMESAGITIIDGAIDRVPQALMLCKKTMQIVKQNLFWAFIYNIIGIPIAAGLLYPFFGIMLNPAIAGSAMAFSSVSVVLNALRLKQVKII